VEIRFYIDPTTGQPHIYRHDVDEAEVEAWNDPPRTLRRRRRKKSRRRKG